MCGNVLPDLLVSTCLDLLFLVAPFLSDMYVHEWSILLHKVMMCIQVHYIIIVKLRRSVPS